MYTLWKYTTMVFLFQISAIVAGHLWVSNIPFAVNLGIVAMLSFVATILVWDGSTSLLSNVWWSATSSTIYLAFWILLLPMIDPIGGFFFAVGLIGFVTQSVLTMAKEAQDGGEKEMFLLLFIAAYPLGIGTVIGGPILFYRRYHHQISSA